MKQLYITVLLVSLNVLAQKTPDELGRMAFKACAEKNEVAYSHLYPDKASFLAYVKSMDPAGILSKEELEEAYPSGFNRSVLSYTDLQEALDEMEIDLKKAVIKTIEVKDEDIDLGKEKPNLGVAKTKNITLHIAYKDEEYLFLLPNTIEVNGRWFISDASLEFAEAD